MMKLRGLLMPIVVGAALMLCGAPVRAAVKGVVLVQAGDLIHVDNRRRGHGYGPPRRNWQGPPRYYVEPRQRRYYPPPIYHAPPRYYAPPQRYYKPPPPRYYRPPPPGLGFQFRF